MPPREKNKKTNIENSQYKVTREESLGPHAEKHTLKKMFINLFVFWLCWVFIAVCVLFLVAMSREYSIGAVQGLLIEVASLIAEPGLWEVWDQ